MPRPIKKRTAKSYKRDIEALGRLRTAILTDDSIDVTAMGKAVTSLDKFVEELRKLMQATNHVSA